jgi:hypothetical protein
VDLQQLLRLHDQRLRYSRAELQQVAEQLQGSCSAAEAGSWGAGVREAVCQLAPGALAGESDVDGSE